MLIISSGLVLLALFLEYYVWTADWWRPETITGTRIGIEDVIISFTNGGLGAVLYEFIFRKRTRLLKKNSRFMQIFVKNKFLVLIPSLIGITYLLSSFWLFGSHSFWSTTIGVLLAVLVMIIFRPDLFINSVIGGVALVLVTIPVYLIEMVIFPGVIEKFWLLQNISGILVLGIPFEDLIFYLVSGMFLAPSYEFIFRKKLVKK
jgi:hypothetical protein